MSHRILVVDDEPAVRDVLRTMLEKHGYTVTEAGDGAQAARALTDASFDLVVTDIVMPEREGLETIRFIRRDFPHIRIIAISAPSNKDYLRAAERFGAERTFTKPFSLSELATSVRDLLAA